MHNYTVNRLVQELFRQPGLLERFRSRRSEVYEVWLDPAQRAGLDDGTPPALPRGRAPDPDALSARQQPTSPG
jgi:hypothetical protein